MDLTQNFAFVLGQVMGLLGRDEVLSFLEVRGVHKEELERFQQLSRKLAQAFYMEDPRKDSKDVERVK